MAEEADAAAAALAASAAAADGAAAERTAAAVETAAQERATADSERQLLLQPLESSLQLLRPSLHDGAEPLSCR